MRRRSYARHFSSAVLLELSFDSLSFQRTLLPAHRSNSREQFTPREALMASWSSAHQARCRRTAKVCPLASSAICFASSDATGRCLGLGIIEHINFVGRMILLTTPVERDMVRIAQFGDVYVTREGGELGQVKWEW